MSSCVEWQYPRLQQRCDNVDHLWVADDETGAQTNLAPLLKGPNLIKGQKNHYGAQLECRNGTTPLFEGGIG